MSHHVDPAAIAAEARTVRWDAVLGRPRRSVPVGDSSTAESRSLTPLIMVRIQVPQPSNFVMSLRIFSVRGRRSDKWTVPVVTLLGDGSKRFNELRRGLGSISQRMLTLTLKGLVRDGLVTRTVFPTIPPRVDYRAEKLGHSLLEPVSRLGLWARQNRAAIQAAGAGSMLPKLGTEAVDGANCDRDARADLIGRLALNSLGESARGRGRGPPRRA